MSTLNQTHLVSNASSGLFVSGSLCKAVLEQCEVAQNHRNGAECSDGACLELRKCRVSQNKWAGCAYSGGGFGVVTECSLVKNAVGIEVCFIHVIPGCVYVSRACAGYAGSGPGGQWKQHVRGKRAGQCMGAR